MTSNYGCLMLLTILLVGTPLALGQIQFYNFSDCTKQWPNYGAGNWRFTCNNEFPDSQHPYIASDVGYAFSQDGLDVPNSGLASFPFQGVSSNTAFSFSYWFSAVTAFPGSVGLEFYSSSDNFGSLQPLGNFASNNNWQTGLIDCGTVACCPAYPCDLQILVLNTKGDVAHPTVAAIQWFTNIKTCKAQ